MMTRVREEFVTVGAADGREYLVNAQPYNLNLPPRCRH